jgi:type IV pilus assembly protein PilB
VKNNPFTNRKRLILSADDDPRIRKIIQLYLTKEGFDVISASSGPEALAHLKTARPDLILLDVMMPGQTGYEVCTQLQEDPKTADIPVIFVTSLGEVRDKARAFAVGAVDHLVKPFSKEDLVKKVQIHLEMSDRWHEILKRKGSGKDSQSVYDFRVFRDFLQEQVDPDQRKTLQAGKISPRNLFEICSELGMKGGAVAQLIAEFIRAPYLPTLNPKDIKLGVLSTRFCRSNHVVPLSDSTADVSFALSNPFDLHIQDTLQGFSEQGQTVRIMLTDPENIDFLLRNIEGETSLEELYEKVSEATSSDKAKEDLDELSVHHEEVTRVDELERSATEAPIIKLANELIAKAIQLGASDLHIEPRELSVGIRYRVDGMLVERDPVPKRIGPPIISRFKIMSSLDIANRRTPQDGRIRITYRDKKLDLRVSTLPARYGEKVVVRFQDLNATSLDFESLGFEGEPLQTLKEGIRKPHGILLVTGPTGSGKTTTLYSALQALNEPDRNIVTVEDPIEYELHRINQVQVKTEAGLTFPVALRAILRQDPDIIMVGEMRDAETADIAIKAALTGHLVLSTLHTNDAPSAILPRGGFRGDGAGPKADEETLPPLQDPHDPARFLLREVQGPDRREGRILQGHGVRAVQQHRVQGKDRRGGNPGHERETAGTRPEIRERRRDPELREEQPQHGHPPKERRHQGGPGDHVPGGGDAGLGVGPAVLWKRKIRIPGGRNGCRFPGSPLRPSSSPRRH